MAPASSSKPSVSTSERKGPIWRGGKIHHTQHLPADEIFRPIVRRDLRRRFPDADLRAEIDPQLISRFACFGKGFCLDDCPDTNVDAFKIGKFDDFRHGDSLLRNSEQA